ncbi:MAG: Ig-like domain-containing protein [Gemmatimonadota bacterium]
MRRLSLGVAALLVLLVGCGSDSTSPPTPTVATVTVSARRDTALVGDTLTLSAEPRDADGHALSGLAVAWSSGTPSRATITEAGVVTAHDTGRVDLTATIAHVSGAITLTIRPVPPPVIASVTVTASHDTLRIGDSLSLTAAARDSAGHLLNGTAFVWGSSDSSRATVSPAGRVISLDTGQVTVTASASLHTGSAALVILPQPLFTVDSIVPHPGDTAVGFNTRVRVFFSRSASAATITRSSLALATGVTTVPSVVGYDPASRSATLQAPLLPGTPYQVRVTAAIHAVAGGTPLQPIQSSFATGGPRFATADATAGAGQRSDVVLDAGGAVDAVDEAGPGVFGFSTCALSCTSAANWHSTSVDQSTGVFAPRIAVFGTTLHAVFWDLDNFALGYARCSSSCGSGISWQLGTIVPQAFANDVPAISLGSGGEVNVVYTALISRLALRFARCASSCTVGTQWTIGVVDSSQAVSGEPALAVDPTNRLYAAYTGESGLIVATCPGTCTSVANWTRTVLAPQADQPSWPVIKLGGSGAVHLVYSAGGGRNDLVYATCTTACSTASNWTTAVVHAGGAGTYQNTMAVATDGRVHIGYLDATSGQFRYASCVASCGSAGNWQHGVLDEAGGQSYDPSLVLKGDDSLRATYHAGTDNVMKYAEWP